MNKKDNKLIVSNEFLAALYIMIFAITRIFVTSFKNYSFLILLIFTILIFLLFVFINRKEKVLKLNINIITIIMVNLLLFAFSVLFNYNVFLKQRLYEFVIYGIVSIFLFSKVEDNKRFLKCLASISTVLFFIYFLDPFYNYKFYSDYMNFGLICMLPIFCTCSIARRIFKSKIYTIISLLSFIELFLFANRGATLSAVVIEFFLYFFDQKPTFKTIFKNLVFIVIIFIIYFNFSTILSKGIDFLGNHNLSSYSLNSIYQILGSNYNALSGRDIIWKNAIIFFKDSVLFGHGIASFDASYGMYTHNLFLEVLTSFGLFGFIVLLILMVKYLKKLFSLKQRSDRYLYILFFVVGIVPLLFSIYTFKWQYFWIFVYLSLNKTIISKKEDDNNENIDR